MCRKTLAILLCAAHTTVGCASVARRPVAPVQTQDRAAMAEYVQRIAAGSRIKVERSGGEVLRGTLMTATTDSIRVQKNTRLPEGPVEVPLSDVARVSLDANGTSSIGKTIAIGVASGVGATLGVLAVLATMWSD